MSLPDTVSACWLSQVPSRSIRGHVFLCAFKHTSPISLLRSHLSHTWHQLCSRCGCSRTLTRRTRPTMQLGNSCRHERRWADIRMLTTPNQLLGTLWTAPCHQHRNVQRQLEMSLCEASADSLIGLGLAPTCFQKPRVSSRSHSGYVRVCVLK